MDLHQLRVFQAAVKTGGFTRAGEVRGVLLVTDKVSGESKGFGCVDMATDADALHAMSSLKGSSIKGGTIRIEQAKAGKRPK